MTGERELSLAVVGIGYANNDEARSSRIFEMMLCKPGEPVELRLEPQNEHDENAIAVFTARGVQLGYLTAERAPWIGGKIKAGETFVAVFQSPGATAAIIRIRFGGGPPTLPPPRPAGCPSDPDDSFYPDPEGPEWGA